MADGYLRIGIMCRILRRKGKWSTAAASQKCGMRESTYKHIEEAVSAPDAENLKRLELGFGVVFTLGDVTQRLGRETVREMVGEPDRQTSVREDVEFIKPPLTTDQIYRGFE